MARPRGQVEGRGPGLVHAVAGRLVTEQQLRHLPVAAQRRVVESSVASRVPAADPALGSPQTCKGPSLFRLRAQDPLNLRIFLMKKDPQEVKLNLSPEDSFRPWRPLLTRPRGPSYWSRFVTGLY